MDRRTFLTTALGAAFAPRPAHARMTGQIPIGYNSYCLRALRWTDQQHIDYAAQMKMDALFLQDSVDPRKDDPAHWREVRQWAKDRGLHLECGSLGSVLPENADGFENSRKTMLRGVEIAAAMGSPIVRCLHAGDRDHLPPGPVEQHMETMIKLLRSVRSQAMDANVKFAIENHKDLLAWEIRQVIETAGKEFVGSYLDTGNPVFVMETPLDTVETLGPYALTLHLRDSIIYENAKGIAVQWVPLGEGVVDFKRIIQTARELCNPLYIHIKPITGRPPQTLPYLDPAFMKNYRDLRADAFARFIALAKAGRQYEGHVVVEDIPGRTPPEPFVAAIRHQQRDHMERSIEYARKTLDLGIKWRS